MLASPTANDTRSVLADWLELLALLSVRRLSSKGDLSNALDIADDGHQDRVAYDLETNEALDEEILDERRAALFQRVFEELEFRAASLGDSYPFQIDSRQMIVRAVFPLEDIRFGQVAYTFCLLATALRDAKLVELHNVPILTKEMELLFQVCACLAAGGYFGGAVCSFGFPRAEGDDFLPALKRAYSRFGHSDVKETVEAGHPQSTKDGGIDVIAWRDHPDGLPSKLYSLGQSASGRNWKSKSIYSDIFPFHLTWFTTVPAAFCLPALYIPFLIYEDLQEPRDDSFSNARLRLVAFQERKFGVILDRLRIAHHVAGCMATARVGVDAVDGTDRAMDIAEWVNGLVKEAGASGVLA